MLTPRASLITSKQTFQLVSETSIETQRLFNQPNNRSTPHSSKATRSYTPPPTCHRQQLSWHPHSNKHPLRPCKNPNQALHPSALSPRSPTESNPAGPRPQLKSRLENHPAAPRTPRGDNPLAPKVTHLLRNTKTSPLKYPPRPRDHIHPCPIPLHTEDIESSSLRVT